MQLISSLVDSFSGRPYAIADHEQEINAQPSLARIALCITAVVATIFSTMAYLATGHWAALGIAVVSATVALISMASFTDGWHAPSITRVHVHTNPWGGMREFFIHRPPRPMVAVLGPTDRIQPGDGRIVAPAVHLLPTDRIGVGDGRQVMPFAPVDYRGLDDRVRLGDGRVVDVEDRLGPTDHIGVGDGRRVAPSMPYRTRRDAFPQGDDERIPVGPQ